MDDERWEALVRRLEPQARSHPAAYRRKVALLALLGYASIVLLLLALLALAGVVVYAAFHGAALLAKLLIPIGILVWVVARSLYVKLDPPDGVRLERREAPELFRMIDEVRAAVRGPKVHRVLVDWDDNASVVQLPRLGGLLGSRNYLVLGLPFLQALSPDEFRAVVAHELGHLSRAHGRFGAFVYRVRATWFQLLASLEGRNSHLTGAMRRFFEWYVPRFTAYTFPIVRQHEFEADAAAAHAAGAEAAASALVSTTLASRWLHETYWPTVYERALDEPSPPRTAFAPVGEGIASAKSFGDVERWYRAQLAVEADLTDTHPSLADRIRHLGLEPDEVLRAATAARGESAARAFLGDAEPAIVERIDAHWQSLVRAGWAQQHHQAQEAKAELMRLDDRARRETLSPDDALRRAQLVEDFRGADDALPLFRELVDGDRDAPARYAIGRILLARGEEEGLRFLDDAIERDPEAVIPACEIAWAWLTDRGREEEAERYRKRAEEQAGELEAADRERAGVSVEDELEPPGLPDELVEQVRTKLARHEEVAEAFVVRKRVEHLADTHPFFVVAVVPRRKLAAEPGERLDARIAREVELPGEFMVGVVARDGPLAKRFAEVPSAKIL